MNSISELRLLTTGPVGLADPGRLAARAAAPASAVQAAEMPSPAPEAGSNPESRGTQIHRRFARFETMDYADGIPDRDFAFGDLLDVINPLQHIPIIGSLYRNLTGDEISGPAKIMGGLLYGGPVGLVVALATTIAEQEVGQDLGEAAFAALLGGEETGNVQLADRGEDAPAAPAGIPDQLPARPAAVSTAIPAAIPAAANAASRAGPQAALSGQDALDAFVRDIKGARPAAPIGGTGDIAAIEAVPRPSLAENVKIGAITPGPLGWTIQRRAEPAGADLLAEAAEITDRAFSERMLRALDKYQAMSSLPPRDEDHAARVDTRI